MEEYTPVRILVTGGCGFIASELCNLLAVKYQVVVIDRIDYCSRKANLIESLGIKFYKGDINDKLRVYKILVENQIDTILHLAAQTHVCRSFVNVEDFIRDNVQGTTSLLQAVCEYGGIKRFLHVSTDEVYGEVPLDREHGCTEDFVLRPTNPYSATKASAEHMVMSYYKSYKIPVIITRGNNVYGHGQYPDKLIPKFICLSLQGNELPIHGRGQAQRTFVHVTDTARAFEIILTRGKVGEIYNIATDDEYSVLEIADKISQRIFGKPVSNAVYVEDRKFNDVRYHINCDKLIALGWSPLITFEQGLDITIEWYRERLAEYSSLTE